jgi:hypothetical protein
MSPTAVDNYVLSVETLLVELSFILWEISTAQDGYIMREEVAEYIQGYARYEKVGVPLEKVTQEATDLIARFQSEFSK